MKPGGCSDAPGTTRHQDCGLPPTGPEQDRETNQRYTAMTFRWLESLREKDELDADWCRLPEDHPPIWTLWWFRTVATVLCIGIVWIFWPFV